MYSAAEWRSGSATRVPGERGGAWGGTGSGLPGRDHGSAPLHAASPPLLQRLLRRGEAGLRKGAHGPPSGSAPTGKASGLQAAGGKGARARATGSYVNGDSGGEARRGLRGRGPGALGPECQVLAFRSRW